MIFKRRDRPPFWDRLREIVYPRKGVWRGVHYVGKRMRRLPDSPHKIALGFACGAFASFTPLFGFHFILAAALAWMLRGNILSSAFGTAIGNPITFPFIAAAALEVGWLIIGKDIDEVDKGFSPAWIVANVDNLFLPYIVGGILPGLVIAVVSYYLVGSVVAAYQERRRKKFAERAALRRAEIDIEQAAYSTYDAREGDNA